MNKILALKEKNKTIRMWIVICFVLVYFTGEYTIRHMLLVGFNLATLISSIFLSIFLILAIILTIKHNHNAQRMDIL